MWALRSHPLELKGTPLQVGSGLLLAGVAILPLIPAHDGVVCPLRAVTGIPCPFCGMTTSVTAVGRGRFAEALAANPAGLVAIAGAVLVLASRPQRVRFPSWALALGVAAMWVFELNRFSIL
jgi:hypothetical protein